MGTERGAGTGREREGGQGWRPEDQRRGEDKNGDGIGEGRGKAKERKKPYKSCKHDVGNGGDLGGNKENVNKKGLVQ